MRLVGIVAVALVFCVVAWPVAYPSSVWRYRLTLEVDTPEGVKNGSGVVQINAGLQPKFTPESGSAVVGARGEAVTVDLGKAGLLFVTLTSPDLMSSPHRLVFDMFPWNNGRGGELTEEGIAYYSTLRAKANIPFDKLPLLVRFGDLANPATVEAIDPKEFTKKLGAGYHIRSATIKLVDPGTWPLSLFGFTGEPVTRGIEQKLSWIDHYYDKKLDGQRFESISSINRTANSLSSGNFKSGN